LSKLFEERIGRKVQNSRQWIGAATSTSDVAALLEIPAGIPMLRVIRITLITGDDPIELVEAHFHPERYQHYNELSTHPARPG
jgi:GntR family transcriptional regulator